jgi:hypothetical protein
MRIRTWIPLFDMDPDPSFHFDAGPHLDSTFRFDVDLDPSPATNLRPLPTGPPWLRFKPPRLHYERPKPFMAPFLGTTAPRF